MGRFGCVLLDKGRMKYEKAQTGGQDSKGKGRATARGQRERALKSSQVVRTGRPRGHVFLSVILERAVLGKTIVIFKKTSKLRIFQMEIIDQ